MTSSTEVSDTAPRGFPWLRILGLVLLAVVLTTAATVWTIRTYVFPSEFEPITLSTKEEQALDRKLERLDALGAGAPPAAAGTSRDEAPALEPEPYREEEGTRQIVLSERELNALLAKNTGLARKLAIDLSGDLVSAKLLMPVDEDFPIIGGQTIKVRAGVELAYRDQRPVVAIKGISVMGVPLPNTWLGGIKHVDLIKEYGANEGFWKSFADGVDDLIVEEGKLTIKLKD